MINFKQYLTEARSAPLYHATSSDIALEIIKVKKILPLTGQVNWKLLKTTKIHPHAMRDNDGVSLTRQFDFAAGWGRVIFEIDQNRLRQNFEIIPINFFNYSSPNGKARPKGKTEAEEFVLTSKGIPTSYVTMIYIDQILWEDMSDEKQIEFENSGFPIQIYDRRKPIRSLRR